MENVKVYVVLHSSLTVAVPAAERVYRGKYAHVVLEESYRALLAERDSWRRIAERNLAASVLSEPQATGFCESSVTDSIDVPQSCGSVGVNRP